MERVREMNADTGYQKLRVTSCTAALGASIEGIDVTRVDRETLDEIHRALDQFSVLVFRDQTLSPAQQIEFTRGFGEVERHPLYRSAVLDGYPEILVLDHKDGQFLNGRNDMWHSDITFATHPPLGSVLYCKAVCTGKGDTMFCSMHRAYESLSPTLQRVLAGRYAVHSARRMVAINNSRSYNVAIENVPEPVHHPVVRTHPGTGRKGLFVNPIYTDHFSDMTPEESRPLLDYLYRVATRPENIYRHRWRVGDLVMFDNRCTMHYVVPDYGPEVHRYMHRTTAAGDRPL